MILKILLMLGTFNFAFNQVLDTDVWFDNCQDELMSRRFFKKSSGWYPTCSDDGQYTSLQCDVYSNCWCVNPLSGKKYFGTDHSDSSIFTEVNCTKHATCPEGKVYYQCMPCAASCGQEMPVCARICSSGCGCLPGTITYKDSCITIPECDYIIMDEYETETTEIVTSTPVITQTEVATTSSNAQTSEPVPVCPSNTRSTNCASNCPKTCDNPDPQDCDRSCIIGDACVCVEGFFLSSDNICIPLSECPSEVLILYSDWSEWTPCSASCGIMDNEGIQIRERKCLVAGMCEDILPAESRVCTLNCPTFEVTTSTELPIESTTYFDTPICWKQAARAAAEGNDLLLPKCDEEGYFVTTQCIEMIDECFCISRLNGSYIEGTSAPTDNFINTCDDPITCPINWVASNCPADCQRTCNNIDVTCADCTSPLTCTCRTGFVLHEGQCINAFECPEVCIDGMEYTECASTCPPTCADPAPVCPRDCSPTTNCQCPPGKVFLFDDFPVCVFLSECPNTNEPDAGITVLPTPNETVCEEGRVHTDCATRCPPVCGNLVPMCTRDCDTDNNCICDVDTVQVSLEDRTCIPISQCGSQSRSFNILPSIPETTASAQDPCGQGRPMVIMESSGVLTSPGYPNNYANNLVCSWLIKPANATKIILTTTDLEMEVAPQCTNDYIRYTFSTEFNSFSPAMCTKPNKDITSTYGEVGIEFKTSSSVQFKGFELKWKTVYDVSCEPNPCLNGGECVLNEYSTSYECLCPDPKWQGDNCADVAMSVYTEWSYCSVTCGEGKKIRYRLCNDVKCGEDVAFCMTSTCSVIATDETTGIPILIETTQTGTDETTTAKPIILMTTTGTETWTSPVVVETTEPSSTYVPEMTSQPTDSCSDDRVYNECPSQCIETCDRAYPSCPEGCGTNKCECRNGTVQESATSTNCIPLTECPIMKLCPTPFVYTDCATSCPRTCYSRESSTACIYACDDSKQCECPPELVQHEGNCIKITECPDNCAADRLQQLDTPGAFVPECDSNGNYFLEQSDEISAMKFCVDKFTGNINYDTLNYASAFKADCNAIKDLPANSRYSECATTCPRTCRNKKQAIFCSLICHPTHNWECIETHVQHNQQCILPENCPNID